MYFFHFRVTDNILAMARPSTETIEKYEIINQFRRYSNIPTEDIMRVLYLRGTVSVQ